jgi:hypothetical protein
MFDPRKADDLDQGRFTEIREDQTGGYLASLGRRRATE